VNAGAAILFVTDDPSGTEEVRAALAGEPGLRVLVASGAHEALETARLARPDVVVLGGPEMDPADFELGRRLRTEPTLAYSTLALVAPSGADELRAAALHDGFDAFLNHPLAATDVLALLHLQLRLRRAHDQLRLDSVEMDRLQSACSRNLEETVALLAGLVDMARPGARDRSLQVGELARRLATRFGVPQIRVWDMAVAAQLHEIGWLVTVGFGSSPVAPWQSAVAAAALLGRVEGLQEAASLLRGLYENWDGTGFPEHQMQGQVPLRCRILRVVIDYQGALEETEATDSERALARLAEHEGTLYDPMVLVHLRAMLADRPAGDFRPDRLVMAVHDLRVGMVLAEDLCTESGLKLLAAGSRITPSTLQTIQRRHMIEPLMQGAVVRRRAA
jgi:response regulator RpfG family c-di-GMP phosphodiesterase